MNKSEHQIKDIINIIISPRPFFTDEQREAIRKCVESVNATFKDWQARIDILGFDKFQDLKGKIENLEKMHISNLESIQQKILPITKKLRRTKNDTKQKSVI